MKYAFNNNGILQDVVMTDPLLLFPTGYAEKFISVPNEAYNGCLWDGQAVSDPAILDATPAPITSITMRQARLALLGYGLLTQVDAAIASLPSPQKEAAQIEWEYAATVERNSALVQQLAPALGLTEAQIDELFVAGAAL